MKTTYTATFSNGQVLTRSSERTYTHAYMVTVDSAHGRIVIDSGFSSNESSAKKNASYLLSAKKEYGGSGDKAYKNRNPHIEIVEVV